MQNWQYMNDSFVIGHSNLYFMQNTHRILSMNNETYDSYIQNPFIDLREYRLSCLLINLVSFYQQRMDLGECPKVHDLALRADFDAASKSKDYYYDIEVSTYQLVQKSRTSY